MTDERRRIIRAVEDSMKPCPFCGQKPRLLNDWGRWLVDCDNHECGLLVRTPSYGSPEGAVAKWNDRKG